MPFRYSLLLLATLAPATLTAQSRPAIRPLGPVTATSTEPLGTVSNIRALPGGRLLINDVSSRRVLLVDSAFTVVAVVADSTPGNPNAYGPRSGALVPFRGDSTLFIDAASLSMLVIDPQGQVGRVMSVPRAQDAMMLSTGLSTFYANGALVYRGMPGIQMRMSGAPGSGSMPQVQAPDSMPLIRVQLQTRKVDTIGFLRIPKTNTRIDRQDDKISINIEVNPLPVVDDWAVTPNGDVAIVRGKDYHVERVGADGAHRHDPKVAFDWKRLTDEDKAQLVDSVGKILERQYAAGGDAGQALQRGFQAFMGGGVGGSSGAGAGAGGPPMVMRLEMRAGDGPAGPVRAPQMAAPRLTVVSASELPDYQPPFFANSVRADEDGNLWVRTIPTRPQPAGSVYDVVNAKGEVTERVLIPEGRTLLGFGPGGVVYLAVADGATTKIERARVR